MSTRDASCNDSARFLPDDVSRSEESDGVGGGDRRAGGRGGPAGGRGAVTRAGRLLLGRGGPGEARSPAAGAGTTADAAHGVEMTADDPAAPSSSASDPSGDGDLLIGDADVTGGGDHAGGGARAEARRFLHIAAPTVAIQLCVFLTFTTTFAMVRTPHTGTRTHLNIPRN